MENFSYYEFRELWKAILYKFSTGKLTRIKPIKSLGYIGPNCKFISRSVYPDRKYSFAEVMNNADSRK